MSRSTWMLKRGITVTGVLLGTVLVMGCATTQNRDPLEPFNRKVFGFNDALDTVLIKPVATGYANITPTPIQTGIANFINNFKDAWSAVNLLLQGRPGEAAEEVLRVGVNSTFGFAGFIDVATSMQLDRHSEDLGQTLAVWGAPDGAYLVLPLFGPSTVRDAIALPVDQYFTPASAFREVRDANGMRVLQVVSGRAQALGATELLNDVALDKYAFVRDAYLQRRRNMIYNGDPPDEQSLWTPEIAPQAVLWTTPVPIPGALDKVLPGGPAAGQWASMGPNVGRPVASARLPMGVLASVKPVPMGEPEQAAIEPSAEELAGLGLRAGDEAR